MVTLGSKIEIDSDENVGRTLTIAIDGPAGAGKSTVAQRVAGDLGLLYIDTGAMYRGATWAALEAGFDKLDDPAHVIALVEKALIELKPPDQTSQGRIRVFVDSSDVTMIIRSRIISKFVSKIAAIGGVRKLLVEKQKALAVEGGVVMDGRDIGTVVLPNADLKIFLTASSKIRAERRMKEMEELGQLADFETLKTEIETRDHMDSTREISPLRQADDAIVISTDDLTINEVVQKILELAQRVCS